MYRIHQQGAGEITRACFHIKPALLTPGEWFDKVLRDFHSAIQLTSRPLSSVRLNQIQLRLPQPLDLTSTLLRHLPSYTAIHLTQHCPLSKATYQSNNS